MRWILSTLFGFELGKELHDGWPDHEIWVTTHGYMNTLGDQCGRNVYGPSTYSMGFAPSSNSGQEMWAGSDQSWPGISIPVKN